MYTGLPLIYLTLDIVTKILNERELCLRQSEELFAIITKNNVDEKLLQLSNKGFQI